MRCNGFWRIDDWGINFQKSGTGQRIYPVRIAVNRWLFKARPVLNTPCQDKGMPSKAV